MVKATVEMPQTSPTPSIDVQPRDYGTQPKPYDVRITAIDYTDDTRNMILEVTDEELLALTGGIVQGMSGSPILQDGKLVGAVTHVFVGEPSMGYGIFADEMAAKLEGTQ